MQTTMKRPWGLGRMAEYPAATVHEYAVAELDPETQLGVFTTATGDVLEMGKHGTSTGKETNKVSTNQDGKGDNDSDQDSDSDQADD
jgi:putative ATP-grasp target RiPP